MTYLANWNHFDINVTPVNQNTLQLQAQSILSYLVNELITYAHWSMVSNSNSTSVSTDTNYWLPANSSSLTWGYNTTYNRSWILLASPVGFVAGPDGSYTGAQSQMYMLIDLTCQSPNAYDFEYDITYYSTLPTGGATNAIPTGGNAQTLNPSGTYVYFLYPLGSNAIQNTARMNFVCNAQGGWYVCLSASGSGVMPMIMYFLPLININTYNSLPYPYAAIAGQLYSYSGSNFSFPSVFDQPSNSYVKGWNYDGTPGSPRCMFLQSGNGIMPGSYATVQGDINNNLFLLPGYIYNNVPGYAGTIGQIPDFYTWGPVSVANGALYPESNPAYCVISQVWLPTPTAFQL